MEQLVIVNRLCLVLFEHRVKELSKVGRDEFETAGSAAPAAPQPSESSRRTSRRGGSSRRTPSSGSSSSSGGSASVARAGVIGESDLFAKMHFSFEFRAKESALLGILNALATNPMFINVTSITLSKATPELVPVAADTGADDESKVGSRVDAAPKDKAEAAKLGPNYPVCGIRMEIPMEVRLELDVYKFREATVDSGD